MSARSSSSHQYGGESVIIGSSTCDCTAMDHGHGRFEKDMLMAFHLEVDFPGKSVTQRKAIKSSLPFCGTRNGSHAPASACFVQLESCPKLTFGCCLVGDNGCYCQPSMCTWPSWLMAIPGTVSHASMGHCTTRQACLQSVHLPP